MRAVVLRGGELTVRDTPDPVPGQGDLLLKTLSTAICASDVHFMDHPELAIDDPTGRSLYDADRDIVMGHEFAGEVIGHGPGCSDAFPIGARVTSMPIRLVDGGAGGLRIIGSTPKRRQLRRVARGTGGDGETRRGFGIQRCDRRGGCLRRW